MKTKFTYEEFEELDKYVSLEGTEIGDYLGPLLDLWEVPESHGKSEIFQEAINVELMHWLERFRNETTIVTTTEPQPDVTYNTLEWD